jgi:hypothetical protein
MAEETKGPELKPCPLCGKSAEIIRPAKLIERADGWATVGGEFHLSFALYDRSDDTVEHNFHSGIAIVCPGCNMAAPGFFEEDVEELAERWNGQGSEQETEATEEAAP